VVEEHLDQSVLSTLQEVMEGEYPTLLDTFLADSLERLEQLRGAADADQLIEAAHSFKGSCGNMGALKLADLCAQLERRAKVSTLADIEEMVSDIDREFAFIRPLYEAERQRPLAQG
jgi:HPt (histidine-containing phosphotransfer) domain-containing protein